MKHKTADLTGADLDAAVAMVHGKITRTISSGEIFVLLLDGFQSKISGYRPSSDWAQGGPIIDREHINISGRDRNGKPLGEWCAFNGRLPLWFGPTPLIAAMRAFVASKLGEEVELP